MDKKKMDVKIVVVGEYQTNCYILSKEGKAIIIDPGSEFGKIKQMVGNDTVIAILLTHRHFDHIGALEECIKEYNVPVYDKSNLEEDNYFIDGFYFKVIFTPGHTDDSVVYYFEDENKMFVGDFIFYGSIGRMDLGGNEGDMKRSINKIYDIDYKQKSLVYPGHGIHTDLIYEQLTNPFIAMYLEKEEND